jgi:hypothetical protein
MSDTKETRAPDPEEDPVPIFGSWRGIYTAVVVWALVFMVFVAAFSAWPY